MKVTVCQTRDPSDEFVADWERLVEHVAAHESELVVLPQMPFYPWFASKPEYDPAVWEAAVAAHDKWEAALSDLAPAIVIGSRPFDFGNDRYHAGFVWHGPDGIRTVHTQAYLSNEEGAWERTWFEPEQPDFIPVQVGPVMLGFLICSELWATEHTRVYGEENVDLLVTPRLSDAATLNVWLAAGRAAAIAARAHGLSSNRYDRSGVFGGQGWIVDPDGEVLALTSPDQPFATADIDLEAAHRARTASPRYVSGAPSPR